MENNSRYLETCGAGERSGLHYTCINSHLTPSELASRERIQRPTATRVLARLEEEGLIQRTADLYDRRSSLLAVTEAGRALLAELRTRKTAFLAERLDTLEPEDRATLERAADILERVLER